MEGHAEWIFELKYDGFRALAFIDDGTCRLVSRNGTVSSHSRHLLRNAISLREL